MFDKRILIGIVLVIIAFIVYRKYIKGGKKVTFGSIQLLGKQGSPAPQPSAPTSADVAGPAPQDVSGAPQGAPAGPLQ